MRVTAALLLCAITFVHGGEIELNGNGCPVDFTQELLYAHEICNRFYQCTHGELVEHRCAADLLFNTDKQECDWPHDTDCGHRVIPDSAEDSKEENNNQGNSGEDSNGDNGGEDNGNGDNPTCNCNPGEAPSICAGSGSEGVLIAHEYCNQFYKCANGVPVELSCQGDLLYNPFLEQCDLPQNVDCGTRVIPECDEENNGNGDNGSGGDGSTEEGDSGDNDNDDNGGEDNGNGNDTGTCNCNPGEAPSICAGSGSEGVLIAHENCNQFYKCSHGVPVAMTCYGELLYNPFTEQCDWPKNVDCGDRVIPECDEENNGNGDNGSGGNSTEEGGSGDNNNGGNGNGDNENGNENDTGTCNCNPGEAPSICAGSSSEGVLIAHENCNQFYKCSHGVPVAMTCYGELLYNPFTEQCDWPKNVDCGDRVIPECDEENNGNGDNGSGGNGTEEGGSGDNNNGGNGNEDNENGNENDTGTCNCNPGEAPSICAGSGSEGVLVAHENCNQFYKCSHGVPVAMTCYGELLYNPFTEQCDWPKNVDCGDRVIPECDEENNGNGDNGSGGNGTEEGDSGDNNNGGNGNGDNENGNEIDTGTCNCNPGEAPSICAGSGSEGVLVAHENCNQFYQCSHGVPVPMTCYGELLYNPFTEQCDWPKNVDCGDRVMPECDEENNGNGDNGSGGNGTEEGGSGDNNNGGNGNGDNESGNENDTGTCNCNPGEAPSICAGSGSEGVLVAHENCNQFYQCSHGVPVPMTCFGELLYNPFTEQCDWPKNVDCGDRLIPECDEENNGNGDNGSGGNGTEEGGSGDNNNGGNGNGDNESGNENDTGTCNCNPGEAPSICAGSDSEGVLVAHENCNQFYQCSHGVPVPMTCYGELLYNPFTEQCDWPKNVDCGDRVIPECDEENNGNGDNGSGGNGTEEGGSGDNNNGGNGNGDNENGNENDTGTCNCNPGEAPSICAGSGSEGVLVAHENCNQFYQCSHGVPVPMTCYGELLYNPFTEQCDWPKNVDCGHRVIPECDEENNGNGDNGSGGNGTEEGGSGDNNNDDNGNGDNGNGNDNDTGTCNCNPGEAPSICAGNGSEGVLVAHENCNQFYQCSHGVPVSMTCHGELLYNPFTEQCDWPKNVDCGDRVIPERDEENNGNGDNGSGGNGTEEGGSGDNNNGGSGNGDNGNGNDNDTGSCNCNPGEAPSICAGSGSEGVLVAHENCNQFYKCSHGVPVAMTCYGELLYNPFTEQCDWPKNVDCGDRVIPECDEENNSNGDNGSGGNGTEEGGSGDNNNGGNGNGDNGNGNENDTGTCNCNPGEAPSICAGSGSEGVLVAHENCNQFYQCSHGVPVPMTCHGELLYNPFTEQCDWPKNVDCGDRVIPECDEENNGNGDNGSGGNGTEEGGSGDNNNGGSGNGDNGNGNDNDTGSCNCNPGEAPSICAGSGSEGVLVAHENCNQFYQCSHGVPVPMTCHGELLYNPFTEQCDWPKNVDCGDRVIPECDEENNGNGDNGTGGNGTEEGGSGDNNNGGSGNGDNGNGNDIDTGSCNCNPGEAPSICAGSGSEGVLVAHENCNQFYKCSHGVPVAMTCYGELLYNPFTEQCDWPKNVDCGDRVIPECDEENNGNGDNGSGGNGTEEGGSGDNNNGGNGNGDNGNGNENDTGTCNCNPGEAPSICAGSGSEGVLVAHENCNQFYKCSFGVPVAMTCYGELLYNPFTEQCDWPKNVDCGDRVIPECDEESDGNGDNGSGGDGTEEGGLGDNNNGGNGNGDNGNGNGNENNNGTCNCNPGEAPSICARSGSEGVLVAHENCNQFYQCSHGVPVPMSCYGELLYNPLTEQCDWPKNVDCGDRVIPECDEENNGNGDNGSGGNGTEEGGSGDNNNGGNGNGDNENGNDNDTVTCNCNPEDAPSICSANGSEGVLIAHENCNQFYKCANGVPVAMTCYGELLYNPFIEQCDWPFNVECGDRNDSMITDGSDSNDSNNGGNNQENGNEPTESNNVEEECDENEIPEVCKIEGSDGVFVAHENCNQFYVCSNNKATILFCPGNLLYDVVSHRCEWPALVDCGNRNIIETDHENDNGGCNCNPLQAPVLCAHEDSEGELIAHENCDQFYKCANGIPVTFNCAANLMYNPYKEVCDWPENVDCEGRGLSYFVSMNKHLIGRKLQVANL